MTNKLAKRFAQAKKVAPTRGRRAFLSNLKDGVRAGTVSESEAFDILES